MFIARRSRNATALLILAAFPLIATAQEPAGQPIVRETVAGRMNLTAAEGDCRVSWELSDSELNRTVIRHYQWCPGAFAVQCQLVARIAAEVFGEPAARSRLRTLSWGRLTPDGARDIPMSRRLALAAFHSQAWDHTTGRPEVGDINRFTRDLCNEARVYPELEEVFRGLGMKVAVAAVEKVLVLPAAELPTYRELSAEGVGPRDRLPFDCQVWFRIEPLSHPR